MRSWIIAFLMLVLFTVSWIPQGQGQGKPVNPGDIYDAAIALFYKEKFEEAIATFSKIILSFPKSNLVSYSRYMIGQCYLKMEKYDEAIQQFDLYLKTYPDGDRVKGANKWDSNFKREAERKGEGEISSILSERRRERERFGGSSNGQCEAPISF